MTRLGAKNALIAVTLLGLPLTLTAWPPAMAAESSCKGLEKRVCDTNSACRWVDGYTRKDGKTVDGYCRMSSTQKGSTESPAKGQKNG